MDALADRMALLEAARTRGDYRLAQALADAIKDGVTQEWRLAHGRSAIAAPETDLPAAGWRSVRALPEGVARWAAGWDWYQAVTLTETTGAARTQEPVDVVVAAPDDWCQSLAREVRVAARDERHGVLRQVPCQVYGEERSREPGVADERAMRSAHLVWQADVPANGQAHYLVFCGNPAAELPTYTTDLQTRGEGHALEIENAHYVATLSSQTGQLERLRYTRAHGLELFAGGEGHGEPPHVDWAHDYLAEGKFQKFRVTNWAAVPNYDVVRGPLCTIVRRWGFPHSPLHPVFTTANMLVDVTYVFHAGAPYFLKHGRMEAVQDFTLNYLRDDEWVFSGYSFTDLLWMDHAGTVHEGTVPPEHAEQMWGVGFFHQNSRDAFFSIRLDHRLARRDGVPADTREPALRHADAPTLNYRGHGQLWSRWALRGDPRLRAGDTLLQRNAYVVAPYAVGDGAGQLEQWRRRLLAPLEVKADTEQVSKTLDGAPSQAGALAGPGEGPAARALKAVLWAALREVRDDMFYTVDASLADMGYVYDLRVRDGAVEVLLTMPHGGRPKYRYLGNPAAARLAQLPGVRSVVVTPVWDPPWTPDRMSDAGWARMGLG